ncbi:PVC-type heme-binding CxxCH protein [Flavitalea flava]
MKIRLHPFSNPSALFCLASILSCQLFLFSCNNPDQGARDKSGQDSLAKAANAGDSLTPDQQRLPQNGLKGLVAASDLNVQEMASEPMLKNPTNIDVDERGRIWVTEAYNYRPAINGNPSNPKGDRIMILEDRNGDGIADTAKVFYQGPEVNAPLGICVLGKKVIISQSPYIWAFYDDNGDDVADRKEILFQGIGGEQHDHGIHSLSFGPDGKLYFNFGNEGKTLKDKHGKPVLDQDGDEIGPKKYKQGMVFRCNPDGSQVECLGHNFRNPYELAVDSYGIIWQSDNDDDGNRGVRINYVMDYGNYGYTDEMTGAGWQANRTNIEDSIPYRHWHLNDPGVVPNLLQTGAGSPTGMVVYEGSLLPAEYRNQVIHCDALVNVVRAYPVKNAGAGYIADTINILKGEKDQWFRPADVCVAPDGSLIVADWYDPGVGGHQAGDQTRGRIYRVAPRGAAYTFEKEDYTNAAGAVKALQNPNLAVRYHAWTSLQAMGTAAIPELEKLWHSGENPRMRARALWVLVKTQKPTARKYLAQAAADKDPNLRMTAIRAAREIKESSPRAVTDVLSLLVNDPEGQVRRECALALHHLEQPEAAGLWATLASQYDGKDRWYLEALGIGADKQWAPFFAAYAQKVKDPLASDAGRDIVWRSRTDVTLPFLAHMAADKNTPLVKRLKYFRAFDFNPGPEKARLLIKMIEDNHDGDSALNKEVLQHLDVRAVNSSSIAKKALLDLVHAEAGSAEYLELVRRYALLSQNPALLEMAIGSGNASLSRDAARLLLYQGGGPLVRKVIDEKDTARVKKIIYSLGEVGTRESVDMLQGIILSAKYNISVRKEAASRIGKSDNGEERVLALLKNKTVPREAIPDLVASVQESWRKAVREEALSYLPKQQTGKERKAPVLSELLALKADAVSGKQVFIRSCATCHKAGDQGFDFGPALTEIGAKYPKDGLLKAILQPSSGISFGFEGWMLNMKDKSTLSGIIASKTETDIYLKFPGGSKQHIKTSDVQSMKEMKTSMMPEGLNETMSDQDLANLLEYLSGLKRK